MLWRLGRIFSGLEQAIKDKDLDAAFEHAHALKGVLANVALTNILEPVQEITEDLRARTDKDYTDLIEKINAEHAKVTALMD